MTRSANAVCVWLGIVMVVGLPRASAALPTMIRLGYPNCAACHLSPQGGGPLNTYGRAIDEAQSLRASEYRPSDNGLVKALDAGGRIQQDLRAVFSEQRAWSSHQPSTGVFRPRLMYRNVTGLGSDFRVAVTLTGENQFAPRPKMSYDPPTDPSTLSVNTALLHYRVTDAVEFAAGKDQLPSGINIPDLGAFTKSRNRLGYYDAPLQVKAFLGSKRYQLMPFVYAPGGNEPSGDRESGAGAVAEFDLLGKGKTVVGMSVLRGGSDNGDRTMLGTYARLGFGRWGILAEHDVTDRRRSAPAQIDRSFQQQTSYAQVFWAVREWLVASGTGERLRVTQPFAEHLDAGKFEVAARLTNQAAISVSARAQHNQLTHAWGRSVAVQVAVKTAQ